jgi:hypothetical protein
MKPFGCKLGKARKEANHPKRRKLRDVDASSRWHLVVLVMQQPEIRSTEELRATCMSGG